MKYKFLIEKEKDEKTFHDKVLPQLKVGETYLRASTTDEDDIEPNKVIGFAYGCNVAQFCQDLWNWCNNNDYGHPDIRIFERVLLDNSGKAKTINVYEF